MNAVYACIGYAVGVLTMIVAFVIYERFRAMEARRFVAEDINEHATTASDCDIIHGTDLEEWRKNNTLFVPEHGHVENKSEGECNEL